MPTEPLPVSDVLDTLEDIWDYTKVTNASAKPGFIEATGTRSNGSPDPFRADLNVNDHIVYSKHGVGKIISVDKAKIGNIEINSIIINYLSLDQTRYISAVVKIPIF